MPRHSKRTNRNTIIITEEHYVRQETGDWRQTFMARVFTSCEEDQTQEIIKVCTFACGELVIVYRNHEP